MLYFLWVVKNLKKFGVILLLYMCLLSSNMYAGIKINFENFDSTSTEATVGDEVDVVYDDVSTSIDYTVLSKPTGSKIKVNSGDGKQKFYFTRSGVYEILFYNEAGLQKRVKIHVKSNNQFTEKEIYDIIQGGYASKNLLLLEKYTEILQDSYQNSLYTKRALYNLFELYKEKGRPEEALVVVEKLLKIYKFNSYEKEELLLNLAKLYESIGELKKSLEVYAELTSLNGHYSADLAEKYMEAELYTKEAIEFLEAQYRDTLNEDIAKYLAEYYYRADIKMAVPYYTRLDEVDKLSEIYIKLEDWKSLENLKGNLDEQGLEKIEALKKKIDIEKKCKDYFKIAEENLSAGKYGVAELYYKRILTTSFDDRLLKDSLYALVGVYDRRRNYTQALKTLKTYVEEYTADSEIGVLNYFAVLNYKLGNYSESKVYFDKILGEYPQTTWARRAKIYSIKILKKLK